MKRALVFLLMVSVIVVLAACGPGGGGGGVAAGGEGAVAENGASADTADEREVFTFWTFVDQWESFAIYFAGQRPDLELEVALITSEWVDTLLTTFSAGTNIPDAVALANHDLRMFVETEFLLPICELLPHTVEMDTYEFTIEAGRHPDGTSRAFGIQATPGAMFFRRSMAREIFGTDDPIALQNYFRDIPTTLSSAQRIHDVTDGQTVFVTDALVFLDPFKYNRQEPWIVDNRLFVDPILYEYIDFAYTLHNSGFDMGVPAWTEGWFAGISDTLFDAAGNQVGVFAYILPTWGVSFVVMRNYYTEATNTFGDWGLIRGPLSFQQGGSWLAVPAGAQNPQAGKDFIVFSCFDPIQSRFLVEGISNESLRAFDPDVRPGLVVGPGDFSSSGVINNMAAPYFDDTESYHFFSGQNSHAFFSEIAPYVSARLMQGTDGLIDGMFNDAVRLYITGQMDREQAMEQFRNTVSISLPHLD